MLSDEVAFKRNLLSLSKSFGKSFKLRKCFFIRCIEIKVRNKGKLKLIFYTVKPCVNYEREGNIRIRSIVRRPELKTGIFPVGRDTYGCGTVCLGPGNVFGRIVMAQPFVGLFGRIQEDRNLPGYKKRPVHEYIR